MVQGNPHCRGGDITRDKRKLAFQTGENDSTLTVYYVPAFPTSWKDGDPNAGSDPHVCYRYSEPAGGAFGVPTFSPDGAAPRLARGDGIHVAAVPSFAGDCTLDGATPTPPLVIPGGREPDWGPADVPAAAHDTPATAPTAATPTTAARPTAAQALGQGPQRDHARGGVKLYVKVAGKGKLTATAKPGKKVVGNASKTVKQGRHRRAQAQGLPQGQG